MLSSYLFLVLLSTGIASTSDVAEKPDGKHLMYKRQNGYQPPTVYCNGYGTTCEEICGAGYLTCGDANSNLCFNPGLGDTCCDQGQVDAWACDYTGFCLVDGYCCPDGDTPDTCAVDYSITLPASYIPPATTPPASGASTSAAASTTSAAGLKTSATSGAGAASSASSSPAGATITASFKASAATNSASVSTVPPTASTTPIPTLTPASASTTATVFSHATSTAAITTSATFTGAASMLTYHLTSRGWGLVWGVVQVLGWML